MELQFHKTEYPYLRTVHGQTQTQEQTQEVKLSEGMPDIGRVLMAWGQPVLRSKEWRSDGAQVTGGIMAWVMYQPEDGSTPRVVEGWLPFQMRWDFPGSDRDGLLLVSPWLRTVEARCISARKLMLRSDVAVYLQALQPDSLELFTPGQLPDHMQILKNTYPLQMLSEAGEKAFLIDEDLLPPEDMEQILYYTLQPVIHDEKVVADKVVFRGSVHMHMLCLSADGKIRPWDHEIPFSQFAELDREYTQASARILPAVTSMELEKGEQTGMRLKAGITGQYAVSRQDSVELAEDAYCPGYETSVQTTEILLPQSREVLRQPVTAQMSMEGTSLDVGFLPGVPMVKNGNTVDLTGHFQVLHTDEEGVLQGATSLWEGEAPAPEASGVQLMMQSQGRPQITGNGIRTELMLEGQGSSGEEKTVVTGITLAEDTSADPNRPSLILRRAGENSLWEIAKQSGSAVDRIMEANGLSQPPEPERMLLIPVI